MDREEPDITPAEAWLSSLNATCNRLSTQYLNLLKAAAGGPLSSSYASSYMMGNGNPIMDSTSGANPALGESTAAGGATNSGMDENETRKKFDRSGGGQMREPNEPPAPLAADAALSTLQAKLAAENICVATCNLLDLIRTLRLSALLMEEDAIAVEEEEEYLKVRQSAREAALDSTRMEEELMNIRNEEVKISDDGSIITQG